MENMFIKAFNMGAAAGWLILAVMFLRYILRNMPPNMRCVLWGFVGIRLSCPWLPQSMFSLIPSAQTVRPDIVYQQEPAIYSGIPVLNQAVNPVLLKFFAPDISASVNPLQIWVFILSLIWAAGMFFMIIYASVSYWRLHYKVRESIKWKDNLYFCDRIGGPFILGLVHPKIYLPSGLAEQAVYIECYEKARLARCDHFWKPLGFVLLTIYWFHPLCWAAYWMFCKDLEFACDEKAVRSFDVHSRKEYSKALLECSVNHNRSAAYPFAFGEVHMKKRIGNVLNYEKPVPFRIAIASAVCVITAVCFLTNPEEKASGDRCVVEEVTYHAPRYSDFSAPQASSEFYLERTAV